LLFNFGSNQIKSNQEKKMASQKIQCTGPGCSRIASQWLSDYQTAVKYPVCGQECSSKIIGAGAPGGMLPPSQQTFRKPQSLFGRSPPQPMPSSSSSAQSPVPELTELEEAAYVAMASNPTARAQKDHHHSRHKHEMQHPDPNADKVPHKFKKLVKLALAAAGHFTIQLSQVGADVTLDAVSLDLPTEEVANVFFAGLNGLMFVEQTATSVKMAIAKFQDIAHLNPAHALLESFGDGGPQQVAREMRDLLDGLPAAQAAAFTREMASLYDKVLDWAAPFFASLMQIALPELGAARAVVEDFLLAAKFMVRKRPYTMLAGLYGKLLNKKARAMLEDKVELTRLMSSLVLALIKMFPPRDSSRKKRVVAALKRGALTEAAVAPFLFVVPMIAAPAAAAVLTANVAVMAANVGFTSSEAASDYVHTQLEEHVLPHVARLAETAQQCMSLVFALLYVIEAGQK